MSFSHILSCHHNVLFANQVHVIEGKSKDSKLHFIKESDVKS